ncbi:MAG: putative transposase [Lentimonas sp.]|jgi:putative transposase
MVSMRELQNAYRSRKRLLIKDRAGVYHVLSRTTCKAHLFGPEEKEMFCNLLFKQIQFAGVELLSYCIMNNHVHLLLRVPQIESMEDEVMLGRYADYYGENKLPLSTYSVSELKEILAEGGPMATQARARILARMGNLPAFMRELKQRFSIWYNHKHDNKGTIWAARYKSLIVEDEAETLTKVAAYIDLNPVRAEIVGDPKDYRWCGYAASLAGQGIARKGTLLLFENLRDYDTAIASYRLILFGKGYGTKGMPGKDQGRISPEKLQQVIKQNGKVPIHELLRMRVRYFTDGVALGSEGFIEELFKQNKAEFGPKRKRGGTALAEATWGPIHVIRNLKRRIYG